MGGYHRWDVRGQIL